MSDSAFCYREMWASAWVPYRSAEPRPVRPL